MRFAKWILAVTAVLGWGMPAGAGEEAPVRRTGCPSSVHLTVTTDGRALVTEDRVVTLPAGEATVEAADVPVRLEPRSVTAAVVRGPAATILSQDYLFDLLDRDHLLRRCVGREVSWIQDDGSRITGTLLSVAGGPVFRVGDDVVFQVPGRLALPLDAGSLRSAPVLRWRVHSDRRGERTLRLTYVTGGVDWAADYVLTLDPDGETGHLQGWVTVENRCGLGLAGARVRLLAGALHRVSPGPRPVVDGYASERALAAPSPPEPEAMDAGDYYLFPLPEPLDLPDRSSRQVRLLDRDDLPVARRLETRIVMGQRGNRTERTHPVFVTYVLQNDEEHGLGRPLPAGVVRLRQRDGATATPLGEDRIPHVPAGEPVTIRSGTAFDVTSRAVMEDWSRRGERTVRQDWRMELHNAGPRDATVEVIVQGTGQTCEVVRCDHRWEKVDAIAFRVPVTVPAGGEASLRWTADLAR